MLWINAHWHHFAKAGWRFLENATDKITGGSGWLPKGGSYVTLVPPEGSEDYPANTFTLIVETLTGTCGAKCNTDPITETQSLSFELKGPLASASHVALWCSTESAVFVKQPDVAIARGILRLVMKPDTLCTATTLLVRSVFVIHPWNHLSIEMLCISVAVCESRTKVSLVSGAVCCVMCPIDQWIQRRASNTAAIGPLPQSALR